MNSSISSALPPCWQNSAPGTPLTDDFSARVSIFGFNKACQFLSPGYSQNENHEYLAFDYMMESTAPIKLSHLCFVLESGSMYEDPLSDFFRDSNVQRGLEKINHWIRYIQKNFPIPPEERQSYI